MSEMGSSLVGQGDLNARPPEPHFRVCLGTYADTSLPQNLSAIWTRPGMSGRRQIRRALDASIRGITIRLTKNGAPSTSRMRCVEHSDSVRCQFQTRWLAAPPLLRKPSASGVLRSPGTHPMAAEESPPAKREVSSSDLCCGNTAIHPPMRCYSNGYSPDSAVYTHDLA